MSSGAWIKLTIIVLARDKPIVVCTSFIQKLCGGAAMLNVWRNVGEQKHDEHKRAVGWG
jgi:hypothetical protein